MFSSRRSDREPAFTPILQDPLDEAISKATRYRELVTASAESKPGWRRGWRADKHHDGNHALGLYLCSWEGILKHAKEAPDGQGTSANGTTDHTAVSERLQTFRSDLRIRESYMLNQSPAEERFLVDLDATVKHNCSILLHAMCGLPRGARVDDEAAQEFVTLGNRSKLIC